MTPPMDGALAAGAAGAAVVVAAEVALARGRGPPRPATDAAGVVEDAGEPVAVEVVAALVVTAAAVASRVGAVVATGNALVVAPAAESSPRLPVSATVTAATNARAAAPA